MNAPATPPVQELLDFTLAFCDDCLNRQDFDAAWQALCRAVNLAPNRPDILSYRGRLALFLKDTENAQRDFASALNLDPRCSAAWSGLARYHLQQGELDEAEEAAGRALGIDPADDDAAQVKAEIQAERLNAPSRGLGSMNSLATATERENWLPKAAGDPVPGSADRRDATETKLSNSVVRLQASEVSIARVVVPFPDATLGFDNDNPTTNGEHLIIRSLIRPGNVVVDAGANVGDWSREVLTTAPGVQLHAFEPAPDTFAALQRNLVGSNASLHCMALADRAGETTLFRYADQPQFAGMNSCYRRPEVEQRLNLHSTATPVASQTLDSFVAQHGFTRIDFLKIDTEGSELDVLHGAAESLAAGRIKLIQFEYGGTYRDASITLRQAYDFLARFGYKIFRIIPAGVVQIRQWSEALENYRYANYLAVAGHGPGDNSRAHKIVNELTQAVPSSGAACEMRQAVTLPAPVPALAPILAATSGCVLSLQRVKSSAGSLEPAFLAQLVTAFGIRAFLETGTYLGNTSAIASEIVHEVHTIELSADLAAQARARFIAEPRVHVYQGDSAELLPQILAGLAAPTLFWLDGHYSEGGTARGRRNTPILDEIAAIAHSGRKDAVILIDDLRLFERRPLAVGAESSLHGYPSVNEVHEAILAIDLDYQFFAFGDVALAFPGAARVAISPLVMALTVSRLYDGANLPVAEVLAAEDLIGLARGEEREVLGELPQISSAVERYGLGLHYRLWHAKTLLGEGKGIEGCRELLELLKLDFPHWRIKWYLAVASHLAGDNGMACEFLDELARVQPDFTPANTLRATLAVPAPASATLPESQRPLLALTGDALKQLQSLNLAGANRPLKLHLGCGENHFDGYVNVDYPPSEHSIQTRIGADVFADITKLRFPLQSVDEIRTHHVFEHFTRPEALALLICWHEWLKEGGRLQIETPDVLGCAEQLVADTSYRIKQAALRHAFGSHEAHWANHYDGWYAEKFQTVLSAFGFTVQCRRWRWPHEPFLANVEVLATKIQSMSRAALLAAADSVLEQSILVEVPSERAMWGVWCKAMRAAIGEDFISDNHPMIPKQVVVKLQGGLGNQMFQFAAGLALARRAGARLRLDLSFLLDRTPRPDFTFRNYDLDLFKLPADCEVINKEEAGYGGWQSTFKEKHFHYDPDFESLGTSVYIDGYWQSPRYFKAVADEVGLTFRAFRTTLNPEQRALADRIRACNAVCLNVRRTDYVSNPVAESYHGVCYEGYFQHAVRYLLSRVPDAHFFIFSDDIEWCRDANLVKGAPCTLVTHDLAGDRFGGYLEMMMACHHFILPNSSFAWWAAFLSQSPDKIVIAPTPWFTDLATEFSDLLPSDWILLSRSSGPIVEDPQAAPAVSVIVPCYKQACHLRETVESVVSQTFGDWELIVVNDGSPDDTSRVTREIIALHPERRIRLLEKTNGGLADARNAGNQEALGKYILPLDADDKIAPDYLAKTVAYLEEHPGVPIVSTYRKDFGLVNQVIPASDYTLAMILEDNRLNYCSLYRREVWQAVGGYDSVKAIAGCDDWSFWIKCAERGWLAECIAEPLFLHRVKRARPHAAAATGFARVRPERPVETNEMLQQRAEALRKASHWVEAGGVYLILTSRLPDDLACWRGRLECSRQMGHAIMAGLVLEEALERHPEWASTLNEANCEP